MKIIAALICGVALAVFPAVSSAEAKELTCRIQGSTSNSAQLDLDESASTAFWHGGGGAGSHNSSATFTSDQVVWKFTEEDSQGAEIDYTFTLNRMTGVLWQTESHYSDQSRRNVNGTISWDCSVSERKF
jgi:hypothetical protein